MSAENDMLFRYCDVIIEASNQNQDVYNHYQKYL